MSSEAQLATRTARLPHVFAGRLPGEDIASLRSMAAGGEWGELLDLLVVSLRESGAPVSTAERDEIADLLAAWGLSGQLDDLVVRT